MFDDLRSLTIDKLPAFLRPMAEHVAEGERVKNEQRRSVLAKEIQVARAAYAKANRALTDAADRARSKRDAGWDEWCAVRNACDAAANARDGASIGHDAYINVRLSEIRSLADPRIAACRLEIAELSDAMRKARPEEHIMKTREVPSPRIESMGMVRQVTRVQTNTRIFRRRLDAIADAGPELERLAEAADVDIGKALAKIRASIPKVEGFEEVDISNGRVTFPDPTSDDTFVDVPAVAEASVGRGPDEWVGRR